MELWRYFVDITFLHLLGLRVRVRVKVRVRVYFVDITFLHPVRSQDDMIAVIGSFCYHGTLPPTPRTRWELTSTQKCGGCNRIG